MNHPGRGSAEAKTAVRAGALDDSRRTMRRLLLALATLTLLAVPAAYAASSSTANDQQIARSLLLVKADLPAGFADKGISASSSSGCTSYSKPTEKPTAKAQGHDFQRQTATDFSMLGTESRLYRNAAAAGAVWTHVFRSKPAGNCLARVFTQSFGKNGGLSNVKLTPISINLGSLKMAAWDLTANLKEGKQTLPLEMLVAGYLRGRAVTMLIAVQGGQTNAKAVGAAASRAIVLKLQRARV